MITIEDSFLYQIENFWEVEIGLNCVRVVVNYIRKRACISFIPMSIIKEGRHLLIAHEIIACQTEAIILFTIGETRSRELCNYPHAVVNEVRSRATVMTLR